MFVSISTDKIQLRAEPLGNSEMGLYEGCSMGCQRWILKEWTNCGILESRKKGWGVKCPEIYKQWPSVPFLAWKGRAGEIMRAHRAVIQGELGLRELVDCPGAPSIRSELLAPKTPKWPKQSWKASNARSLFELGIKNCLVRDNQPHRLRTWPHL